MSEAVFLRATTPERLSARHPDLPMSEARKLIGAVHKGRSLEGPLPQVRRTTMDWARAQAQLPELTVQSEQRSTLDPFVKFLLRTKDQYAIETVRIPLERPGRFCVCVSSQAGCALACSFCATGRLGLLRNLEAWEIIEQVRLVRQSLAHERNEGRIHGVVFQGMGEPLANTDRVLEAIEVMSEPCALAIDARNITVCTSGLPVGIVRLARAAPKVRLALSVHAAVPAVRRRIMPIDKAHPLDEVLDAAAEHVAITGLTPMWAITLLQGVNDSDDDAGALLQCVRSFWQRTGKRPRLSIIPYNAVAGDPYERSNDAREAAFRRVLGDAGIPTHKRYSGGSDVGAACGQLAGQEAAR